TAQLGDTHVQGGLTTLECDGHLVACAGSLSTATCRLALAATFTTTHANLLLVGALCRTQVVQLQGGGLLLGLCSLLGGRLSSSLGLVSRSIGRRLGGSSLCRSLGSGLVSSRLVSCRLGGSLCRRLLGSSVLGGSSSLGSLLCRSLGRSVGCLCRRLLC